MNPDDPTHSTLMAPRELAGPLPRRARLYSTDGRNLLLIALLFFACGAIFTVSYCAEAIKQTQARAALRSDSAVVAGEVTGFSIGRWAPTVVEYTFTYNGTAYSGKAKEPRSSGPWTAFNESDKIFVRFLPSNPAVNHPAAWEWSALMGLDSIIFQIFLLTMSGVALIVLLRDRKLARDGTPAAGEVVACTPKNRQFQVSYEFCTESGQLIKGESGSRDPYEVGARIWILYIPQNPGRNHSYPLDFFEIAE